MKMICRLFIFLAAAVLGVNHSISLADDYDPLTFTPNGDTLIVEGVIDDRAIESFIVAINENPNVKSLTLKYVPGSADDDYNLILSRVVRSMGLGTIIPKGGLVASGGTDLFLAGVWRKVSTNACIGVHSWDYEEDGHIIQATDFPKHDLVHQMYLRYFRDMGIPPAFYWYTLDAAPAADMHWMHKSELKKFNMVTEADVLPNLGTDYYCDRL
ncbi:hypothetical protein [Curvivirga sp.]|uniref:COG3904 family protein n=1 Tax=Curvivirga sp. TaxID=2856848 RepID=UPI003B591832